MSPALFTKLSIRDVTIPNRIGVSPMCQYWSRGDGLAHEWHLVHLGSRAVGGAGLVMTEAAAVVEEGRITHEDLGIWSDRHSEALAPVAAFIAEQGAVPGIQMAHAGRKASTKRPWEGAGAADANAWEPVGATGDAFMPDHAPPRALGADELAVLPSHFAAAAVRARDAGFRFFEIHAAHGYLLHEFLSPLSNTRTDAYGGTFEGRTRLVVETVRAVREAVGEALPISVRLSATDWAEAGWTGDDTVAIAPILADAGADLIDCSSGGNNPQAAIPLGPGYQVCFAERVKREAGMLAAAVGLITDAQHANEIVRDGKADLVLLGREMLRDPYWPRRAALALGAPVAPPVQYARAH